MPSVSLNETNLSYRHNGNWPHSENQVMSAVVSKINAAVNQTIVVLGIVVGHGGKLINQLSFLDVLMNGYPPLIRMFEHLCLNIYDLCFCVRESPAS